MNNALIKSLILALATAIAIGGVLFFIQTVVSPPEDIKIENSHSSDIQQFSASYNPDSLGLNEGEKMLDAIVDRATIYQADSFIDQKTYDEAIVKSAEKFSATFVNWAMNKFAQTAWNSKEHAEMLKIIAKLRNVKVDQGSKKALDANSLASLTKIESIINEYGNAWAAARQTSFIPWNYDGARTKRTSAESYARKQYLSNCASLVASLNAVGGKLEQSCYYQLTHQVNKLQNLYSFSSKDAYNTESSRVYDLIQAFKKTSAFGVSTSSHASVLEDLQDSYDKAAEEYEWTE